MAREWCVENNRLLVDESGVMDTDGSNNRKYTYRDFLATRSNMSGAVLESIYGAGYQEALALVLNLRHEQKPAS